jgi:hypothetical protein
MHNALVVG